MAEWRSEPHPNPFAAIQNFSFLFVAKTQSREHPAASEVEGAADGGALAGGADRAQGWLSPGKVGQANVDHGEKI